MSCLGGGPYYAETCPLCGRLLWNGRTELTPRNFWLACGKVPAVELIGQDVRRYSIVEIDDGLRPYCFYRLESCFIPLPYFHTETARNNAMEDDA